MDPNTIVFLFAKATELIVLLRNAARDVGITDAQLDAVDADYAFRISRREAEAAAPPTPPVD